MFSYLRVCALATVLFISASCAPPGSDGSDGPTAGEAVSTAELDELLASVEFSDDPLAATFSAPLMTEKLPPSRMDSIEKGAPAAGRIRSLIDSGKLAGAKAQMDFWCSGGDCICFGDSDCNDMFSTVCRDPSTGGACYGEPPVCVCSMRVP